MKRLVKITSIFVVTFALFGCTNEFQPEVAETPEVEASETRADAVDPVQLDALPVDLSLYKGSDIVFSLLDDPNASPAERAMYLLNQVPEHWNGVNDVEGRWRLDYTEQPYGGAIYDYTGTGVTFEFLPMNFKFGNYSDPWGRLVVNGASTIRFIGFTIKAEYAYNYTGQYHGIGVRLYNPLVIIATDYVERENEILDPLVDHISWGALFTFEGEKKLRLTADYCERFPFSAYMYFTKIE
jgi:hypothetical protein